MRRGWLPVVHKTVRPVERSSAPVARCDAGYTSLPFQCLPRRCRTGAQAQTKTDALAGEGHHSGCLQAPFDPLHCHCFVAPPSQTVPHQHASAWCSMCEWPCWNACDGCQAASPTLSFIPPSAYPSDEYFYLTPKKRCALCPEGCSRCTSATVCTKWWAGWPAFEHGVWL